jgi:hypothetical protein
MNFSAPHKLVPTRAPRMSLVLAMLPLLFAVATVLPLAP